MKGKAKQLLVSPGSEGNWGQRSDLLCGELIIACRLCFPVHRGLIGTVGAVEENAAKLGLRRFALAPQSIITVSGRFARGDGCREQRFPR